MDDTDLKKAIDEIVDRANKRAARMPPAYRRAMQNYFEPEPGPEKPPYKFE